MASPNAFAQLLQAHVVEQDDFRSDGQRSIELGERFDFDLHRNAGSVGPGLPDRGADGIGIVRQRGQVIVLDQNSIVESDTVVVTAALAHAIFFEQPPAGRGLARVEQFHG